MKRLLVLAGLLVALVAPAGAQSELEIRLFTLNNRMPSATVEAVRPFLSAQGTVVPDDRSNLLIVKDYPQNLAQIARLLERLDQPAPLVRIQVDFSGAEALSGGAYGVQWISGPNPTRIGVVAGQVSASAGARARQSLLVMSGEEGRIEVGRDIVSVQPYWSLCQHHGLLPPGVVFQRVSTGFLVSPTVAGETIRLSIVPWISYESAQGPGQVRFDQAATSLTLRSGDSVVIASGQGSAERQTDSFGLILGSAGAGTSSQTSIVLSATVQPDGSTPEP